MRHSVFDNRKAFTKAVGFNNVRTLQDGGGHRPAVLSLDATRSQRDSKNFMEELPAIMNEVSDETGQFDPRFVLWRKFCADQGIGVDSLPCDLSGDLKAKWEKMKEREFGSTNG